MWQAAGQFWKKVWVGGIRYGLHPFFFTCGLAEGMLRDGLERKGVWLSSVVEQGLV